MKGKVKSERNTHNMLWLSITCETDPPPKNILLLEAKLIPEPQWSLLHGLGQPINLIGNQTYDL
jgi:hypothetical protein